MEDRRRPATALTLFAAFVAFGVFWGALTATAADLERSLGLSHLQLGLLFAVFPLGGVPAGVFFAGPAVRRYGARAVGVGGGIAFFVCGALFALAPPWAIVPVALAIGASSAMFDIGINAQAVTVEAMTGSRFIGRLHGGFFLGAFAGGLLAAAIHAGDVVWRAAPVTAALVGLLIVAAMYRVPGVPGPIQPEPPVSKGGTLAVLRTSTGRRLVGIVVIGFLMEGVVDTWSGVYLRDDIGSSAAVGAIVVAACFLGNAVGASICDPISLRYGTRALFAAAGVGVAVGVVLAVATTSIWPIVIGLPLAAISLAMFAPGAFSEAGRSTADPVQTISGLAASGYLAFLVGPIASGVSADIVGLRSTIGLIAFFGIGAAVLGRSLPQRQPVA